MDISESSWNENNEGNTSPAPRGMPNSSAPTVVYPTIRYVMGAIKRSWNRSNAMLVSTGTNAAYVLTYPVPPSAGYVKGEVFRFFAHTENSGGATLNINNLGARVVVNATGIALTRGDIPNGACISVVFDGTNFRQLDNLGSSPQLTAVTAGTIRANGALTVGTTLGVTGATTLSSTLRANGATTLASTLAVTGAATFSADINVTGRVSLGSVTAASVTDLSRHVALFGTSYGFNVTGDTLNIVANGGAANSRVDVQAEQLRVYNQPVWHSGNMGPGSGLNGDLLDGQHGAFYQNAANLNAGILPNARLSGAYSFTSLALTSALTVGSGAAASTIIMADSDEGNRSIHNNGGNIGFLSSDNGWAMRVNDAGVLWTRKMLDVEAHIETRANAHAVARANDAAATRISRTGDTMTGDLEITKGDPSVWFHFPNVKRGRWVLNSNGSIIWQDANGTAHFYITNGGAVWTQQFGDLGSHIETRASVHAQNGINAANAKVNEIRTVSEYVSGNEVTAGTVVINTHISNGFLTTTKAYMQIHRPDRGWSTMWRN